MSQLTCTVERKTLAAALATQGRIIERRNTIPILGAVLLAITPDKLTITGTDLDIIQTEEIPAATSGEGAIAIDHKAFADAVKKMKGDTVRIADVGGAATLQDCQTGATVRLQTRPACDYPVIAEGDAVSEFHMGAMSLVQALSTTALAMSTEETRYYLMGVYLHTACDRPADRTPEHEALDAEAAALRALDRADERRLADMRAEPVDADDPDPDASEADLAAHIIALSMARLARSTRLADIAAITEPLEAVRCAPNVLRFASTDGHRLVRVTRDLPSGAADLPDVIVPRKAVNVLTKLIGTKPKPGPSVYIRASATKMTFQYGRVRITSKMIDGTFPDYTRVIPTMNDKRLIINGTAFADGVDGAASIASERTRAVTISVDTVEPLIIACTSPENGTAANIVEGGEYVPTFGGDTVDSLVIGFNATYLSQALRSFGDRPVMVDMAEAAAPTAFTSEAMADVLIVLMPMRVGSGITTRAAVDRLYMDAWQAFRANAAAYANARTTLYSAKVDKRYRGDALRALAKQECDAIDHIVATQGTPRCAARQVVKADIAAALGDAAAETRHLLIVQAMTGAGAEHGGAGFKAVAAVAADTPAEPVEADAEGERDLAVQDPGLDPATPAEAAPAAEAEPVDDTPAEPVTMPVLDPGGDVGDAAPPPPVLDPRPPEPVALPCEGQPEPNVEPAPAEGPVDVVKVLTLTGQALYVAAADWQDETVASLPRYHKDGFGFYGNGAQRRVHRSNIERQVLPRNNGDKPLPVAAKAPETATPAVPVDSAVAARLAALERIVAGLGTPERVAELEAQLADVTAQRDALWRRRGCARQMVRHALKLRGQRAMLRSELASAVDRADRYRVRCDALERLAVDSGPLDTAAAGRNGQPTIILPVSAGGPGFAG